MTLGEGADRIGIAERKAEQHFGLHEPRCLKVLVDLIAAVVGTGAYLQRAAQQEEELVAHIALADHLTAWCQLLEVEACTARHLQQLCAAHALKEAELQQPFVEG